jgi:hypothetical protein
VGKSEKHHAMHVGVHGIKTTEAADSLEQFCSCRTRKKSGGEWVSLRI